MRWGSSPGRGALARCTPPASRRRWKGCGTRAPVSPCRALASPIPDDLRLFSPQSRSLSIRPSLPIPYRTAWGIASAGFMVYTGSAFPPSWSAPKQAARRRSTSRSRRLIESSQWSILPTAQPAGLCLGQGIHQISCAASAAGRSSGRWGIDCEGSHLLHGGRTHAFPQSDRSDEMDARTE